MDKHGKLPVQYMSRNVDLSVVKVLKHPIKDFAVNTVRNIEKSCLYSIIIIS